MRGAADDDQGGMYPAAFAAEAVVVVVPLVNSFQAVSAGTRTARTWGPVGPAGGETCCAGGGREREIAHDPCSPGPARPRAGFLTMTETSGYNLRVVYARGMRRRDTGGTCEAGYTAGRTLRSGPPQAHCPVGAR